MQKGDDNWTAVTIHRYRLNGLRLLAARRKRSVGQVLDDILEKAKVEELSDAEFARKEKEVAP